MCYINIGKITSTHGLKGELKLKSSFIHINKVLKPNFPLFIGNSKEKVNLLKHRFHNGTYLLTFQGYEDINLVENFRNKEVYVLRENLELQKDEFLFEDYIGLIAYYKETQLGTVKDIVNCGNSNYVFYIKGDKEVLIPVNKKFIKDVTDNKIAFKDVEGLIDAN